MLTQLDCSLRAENFAVAAHLEPTEMRHTYLRLAACWRARAIRAQARAYGLHIPQLNILDRSGFLHETPDDQFEEALI